MENRSNTSEGRSFKQQPIPGSLKNVAEKEPVTHTSMAGHLNDSQDAGLHARNISTVSTVDSEMIDEDGNPIWKYRVESWKDKKNKKKKSVVKVAKEVQIRVDQEKQGSTEANAMQPLSQIVPIPKSQITPYRLTTNINVSIKSQQKSRRRYNKVELMKADSTVILHNWMLQVS
ncbi:unnamed protein product [Lactuca virosa]|uniref:Uncharacterized protein n=1 Tax=Lactuca virosa TaxID=75947 RepID=A0AAU9PWH1_9ASTR|nr:unnamed protein product [Lactuca virosa]